MDLNRIIQALKGTIDPKLRIAAENELNQVSRGACGDPRAAQGTARGWAAARAPVGHRRAPLSWGTRRGRRELGALQGTPCKGKRAGFLASPWSGIQHEVTGRRPRRRGAELGADPALVQGECPVRPGLPSRRGTRSSRRSPVQTAVARRVPAGDVLPGLRGPDLGSRARGQKSQAARDSPSCPCTAPRLPRGFSWPYVASGVSVSWAAVRSCRLVWGDL